MKRRTFLKMMGIAGATSLTNWKTLVAGPKPGSILHKNGNTYVVCVAQERIRDFQLVIGNPFEGVSLAQAGIDPNAKRFMGVAESDAEPGEAFLVCVQGRTRIRTRV